MQENRCVRCDFRWSFVQDRLVVSNDSCNTFCRNVSKANKSRCFPFRLNCRLVHHDIAQVGVLSREAFFEKLQPLWNLVPLVSQCLDTWELVLMTHLRTSGLRQETDCLVELYTHLWCLDQINFINRVGMPLVTDVRNELGLPTFLIRHCLALLRLGGRRSDMLVCGLSCLFLLHQTIQQNWFRGTAGNLSDKLHSSTHAVFRS